MRLKRRSLAARLLDLEAEVAVLRHRITLLEGRAICILAKPAPQSDPVILPPVQPTTTPGSFPPNTIQYENLNP
jgi:hypothetical protein